MKPNMKFLLILMTGLIGAATTMGYEFVFNNLTSKPIQVRFELHGYHEPKYVLGGDPYKTKQNYNNIILPNHEAKVVFEAEDIFSSTYWERFDYARKVGFCIKYEQIEFRDLPYERNKVSKKIIMEENEEGALVPKYKIPTSPDTPAWIPLDLKFIEPGHMTAIRDAARGIANALQEAIKAAGELAITAGSAAATGGASLAAQGAALAAGAAASAASNESGAAGTGAPKGPSIGEAVSNIVKGLNLGGLVDSSIKAGEYSSCKSRTFYIIEVPPPGDLSSYNFTTTVPTATFYAITQAVN